MDVLGWECAKLWALRAILGEEGVATVCCAGLHAARAGSCSCDRVVSAACDRTTPSLSAPAMQHARLRPCPRPCRLEIGIANHPVNHCIANHAVNHCGNAAKLFLFN